MNFDEFKINDSKEETDEIPEVPEIPKSKVGDVYQLGRHKIICADCTIPANITKLLGDTKINQLLTDPPYGIGYSAKNAILNEKFPREKKRNETKIKNDDYMREDYSSFTNNFLEKIPFADYNTIYIWAIDKQFKNIFDAFEKCKINFTHQIIWLKNNHVMTRSKQDHSPKHEACLYGWKGKHKFYGGFKTTIYEYDKPVSNDLHLVMKPVPLMAELVTEGSQKDDVVYDPFLGSGSTLIACEQTGRTCYGMEIDPGYIDVIIERFENFTEQKAEKINE